MQNNNSSYLPAQILIIHVSHKERFCGKGIRLHFYICSCNLKTIFIHTHLLKISWGCKQCNHNYNTISLLQKNPKKWLFRLLCKHFSIRKYINRIYAFWKRIIFKSETYCDFPFIAPRISISTHTFELATTNITQCCNDTKLFRCYLILIIWYLSIVSKKHSNTLFIKLDFPTFG